MGISSQSFSKLPVPSGGVAEGVQMEKHAMNIPTLEEIIFDANKDRLAEVLNKHTALCGMNTEHSRWTRSGYRIDGCKQVKRWGRIYRHATKPSIVAWDDVKFADNGESVSIMIGGFLEYVLRDDMMDYLIEDIFSI